MNKNHIKINLIVLLLGVSFASWGQIINTIAGNGYIGYSGDGGPATAAQLNSPVGVAIDAIGNVYIADNMNNRIRKVNTSGIISTFVGNGTGGFSGDGGTATAAELWNPEGLAIDASGNVYIADQYNERIRIVNTAGIISTFAGCSNFSGYSGDGGLSIAAELWAPTGVAVDASGNVYIADMGNERIRKVNTAGIINTIAGNGYGSLYPGYGSYSGDGGPATVAELNDPCGVEVDALGNIYIADCLNNRIRIVNTSGIINTFAGDGYGAGATSAPLGGYSGDGGPATVAELYGPHNLVLDAFGNVYIADQSNDRIRIINSSGTINTYAGNGVSGYFGDGGQATAAELYYPQGVAVDAAGNVFIADSANNCVRKVNSVTGISQLSSSSNEITIYPIPTTGSFTIKLSVISGQSSDVEIYNMLGEKVYSQFTIYNSPFTIDLSGQPNGIYLVRIENQDGSVVATKKMVKEE